MKNKRNKRGQAMVEYIIIVVLVAVAAIAIFAVFSDTLRSKLGGAVNAMDTTKSSEVQDALSTKSVDALKSLDGTQPSQ